MIKIKATFVSVWDGGFEIRTKCMFNPKTNDVTDIESVDNNSVDVLDEQYVELASGERITDFTIEGVHPDAEEKHLSEEDTIKLKSILAEEKRLKS